ncbi:MAG: hypothetical protein U0169_06240 [Polyangiaceae bacterium]
MARRRSDGVLAGEFLERTVEQSSAHWEARPLAFERSLPEAVRAERRRSRLANTPKGLACSLLHAGLGRWGRTMDAVRAAGVPTHVMVGAHDAPYVALSRTFEGLPNVTVHVVPEAGHDVVLARPDAVAAVVLAATRPLPRILSPRKATSHAHAE